MHIGRQLAYATGDITDVAVNHSFLCCLVLELNLKDASTHVKDIPLDTEWSEGVKPAELSGENGGDINRLSHFWKTLWQYLLQLRIIILHQTCIHIYSLIDRSKNIRSSTIQTALNGKQLKSYQKWNGFLRKAVYSQSGRHGNGGTTSAHNNSKSHRRNAELKKPDTKDTHCLVPFVRQTFHLDEVQCQAK